MDKYMNNERMKVWINIETNEIMKVRKVRMNSETIERMNVRMNI